MENARSHSERGALWVKRAVICVWPAALHTVETLLTDHGRFPLPDEKNSQLQEGASVTEIALIHSRRVEGIDRPLWLGRSLEMEMELVASAVTGLLVAGRTWTLRDLPADPVLGTCLHSCFETTGTGSVANMP